MGARSHGRDAAGFRCPATRDAAELSDCVAACRANRASTNARPTREGDAEGMRAVVRFFVKGRTRVLLLTWQLCADPMGGQQYYIYIYYYRSRLRALHPATGSAYIVE